MDWNSFFIICPVLFYSFQNLTSTMLQQQNKQLLMTVFLYKNFILWIASHLGYFSFINYENRVYSQF